MDLEIIIFSEIRQTKIVNRLNIQSKKKDTNELICETAKDSQT